MLINEVVGGDGTPRCCFNTTQFFGGRELPSMAILLDKRALADPRYSGEFSLAHLLLSEPILEDHLTDVSIRDTVCQHVSDSYASLDRIQSRA
jgi:hypothetical protein